MNPIYQHLDGVWAQELSHQIIALPATVTLAGTTYQLRSHLHTTLVSVKTYAPKLAEARRLDLDTATTIIRDHIDQILLVIQPRFSHFRPDLRIVAVADPTPRQTIILRAQVNHLSDFFAQLSRRLDLELPLQPSHATLYAVNDLPIGLASEIEMAQRSRPCTPAELDQWRAAVDSPAALGVKL